MGNSESVAIPQSTAPEPYFALYFERPDKIRIILADKETVEIIRHACFNSWTGAILKDQYEADGSYVLKFDGYPWSSGGDKETAITSKIVAIRVLCDLYAAGWDCLFASDLSRSQNDLSTWFFQRVSPVERQKPSMICVSLSSTDSLQFIPSERGMNEILKYAVQRSYAAGIQEERCDHEKCYELKLHGYPWSSSDKEEGVEARKMILEIIRQFHVRGYRFYVTANLKDTADCLFFIQQPIIDTPTEKFCIISLNSRNCLRLIDSPAEVIEVARQTIANYWTAGLKNESDLGGGNGSERSWELKMRGYPWLADGEEAVQCRLFLTHLFSNLLQRGWCMITALDVTRRDNDKAVFVLRSCQPSRVSHICVSLNEECKLRLISAGPDILNITRQVISGNWPEGIKRESDFYGSHEFKMNGRPWDGWHNPQCLSTAMMCRLLAALSKLGWRVVLSADVSSKYYSSNNGPSFSIDVHSWFAVHTGFIQQPMVGGPEQWDVEAPPPAYHEAVVE